MYYILGIIFLASSPPFYYATPHSAANSTGVAQRRAAFLRDRRETNMGNSLACGSLRRGLSCSASGAKKAPALLLFH